MLWDNKESHTIHTSMPQMIIATEKTWKMLEGQEELKAHAAIDQVVRTWLCWHGTI